LDSFLQKVNNRLNYFLPGVAAAAAAAASLEAREDVNLATGIDAECNNVIPSIWMSLIRLF
jgi:hypothetical protein